MTATNLNIQQRKTSVDPAAMSYYLALRHLPKPDMAWIPHVTPTLPTQALAPYRVGTADEVMDAIDMATTAVAKTNTSLGLLLSGGIDSAILAAFVPPRTPCFTLVFDAPGAIDESEAAAAFASHWGHPHQVIKVRFADYLTHADHLMANKAAPLHAIEVPLYLAAHHARLQGISTLVVGNGADSTFGGMDKLLAKDWGFEEFVQRYSFVDPQLVLTDPRPIVDAFEPYRRGNTIDVPMFLHDVHGQGIVQSFENAIGAAGVRVFAPYEQLESSVPLDIARIRSGEPKYMLAEAFKTIYDTDHVPTKVAFARPMEQWFASWPGPEGRPEFRDDIAAQVSTMDAEARWLTWCLDRFASLLDVVAYAHG